MTEKPTVILSQRFSTDSQAVWNAARKLDWNIHRAIRFSVPEPLPAQRCVYGEMTTCDIIAERADLALLEPPCGWLAGLPLDLVKRRISFVQLWELRAPHFDRRLFFKPANDKLFEKGVFERGDDVPTKHIDRTCPCLVSDVVAFDREVRLWCLDGKIMALDFYRIVGDYEPETVLREAMEFGSEVMADHADELPSSVVVDVGYVEGSGWAVVEANQAYASGIYGDTDPEAVLQCVLRAAGPRELVRESDRRFVRS
jgi:hypothetical protein